MTTVSKPVRPAGRRGYSLLEVILAIAILAGAVTAIGHLMRIGTSSAGKACDLARVQLLCESKLIEITSGVAAPEPVRQVPFDTDPEWLYSVDMEPTDREGLLAVRVTVGQDPNSRTRPVTFSFVRWMPDPAVEPTEESSEADTTARSTAGDGND